MTLGENFGESLTVQASMVKTVRRRLPFVARSWGLVPRMAHPLPSIVTFNDFERSGIEQLES